MKKRPNLRRRELHFHVPFSKVQEYLPSIRAQALSLELYFSAHDLDNITEGALNILKALDYGPSITVHGPFMDLNPGAVDPLVRDATLRRFKHALEVARSLGARMVVFHSGYEKWKYALKTEPWLEASVSFWKELEPLIKDYGLSVAIENIFEDTPDNLRALMEALDCPHIGLCFDTGHFNLFSRVSLNDWLGATGRFIKELHIHDNNGTSDAHLAPSKGTFDFDTLFGFLEDHSIKPLFTIEAHTPEDVIDSLRYFGC